jgi:UDP-N-acetylglucosamine--N-acetylmuramyl-(pentapeptide) pyrophosphoryl-undecaprenol N-acetylglucosamine transferase
MRLLIAGGGTGGHIYPALAVARSLLARPDGAELRWLGGHRGLEATLVPAAGIRFQRLALRSLRTVQKDVHLILDPLRLGAAVPQAAAILARWRPAAILTTGGYVAVPVLLAAGALRVPSVLWEGNVIPGKSARFVARMASAVAVSHPATIGGLGIPADRAFVTGTPIRRVDTVDREAARRRFGIPPGDRVLLVFGGSQAVRRFNAAVAEALPELVARVHLIHVAGEGGYAAALAQKGTLPEAVRRRYQPFPFLRDEMTDALAAADLAVGRAGASTLAEAAAFGLPLAIVPYPHAAGHQIANATAHIEAGAGELIADEEFDAAALLRMAEILADPAKHAEMSAAARALARPGAADAVADLVLAAAARRPFPDQATIDRRARGATA